MKTIKFIVLFLMAIFFAFASYASNWQNEKLDINIYSKKNSENNFNILVELTLKNGWAISWDNPGDAGVPTTFDWNENIKRINASRPEKKVYEDIVAQYGYFNKAYYLFEGNSTKNDLSVNISWEACKDECQEENATINFTLSHNEHLYDAKLEKAKQTFPINLKNFAYSKITYQQQSDIYFLNLFIQDFNLKERINSAYFIPYQKSTIVNAYKQNFTFKDGLLHIRAPLEGTNNLSQGGLIVVNDNTYEINFVPKDNSPSLVSFSYILLLAFIGGFILNFMPCVFPVLSLKALTIKQNQDRKQNIKNAFYYLSGVILSFLIMAFFLYVFRKTGQAIGWGFQLQSPIFVSIMLIVFIILLLMILEIIGIKPTLLTLFSKLGSVNDFMAGFFAVLIASPCTGPFLGVVLGFTLLQSPSIYFMIFFLLGLGYALPFALIEIYPDKISKIMPKSGKWMKTIKYILAIPVFLTCLWLAWVLYYQLSFIPQKNNLTYWKNYDEIEIRNLINKNNPVFIDFTAKWCLTCLLNEKSVLHTDNFIKFAKENNISLYKADWTEHNETIGNAIKYFGRNSVPLYVYYPPLQQKYILLPQILTMDKLKSVLNSKYQN